MNDLVPLMNDTKWDELRFEMYALDPPPRWRIKDVRTGDITRWDREWYYHFLLGGYVNIEWVEIEAENSVQAEQILSALRAIHVPGRCIENGFRVYGYVRPGEPIDYL